MLFFLAAQICRNRILWHKELKQERLANLAQSREATAPLVLHFLSQIKKEATVLVTAIPPFSAVFCCPPAFGARGHPESLCASYTYMLTSLQRIHG
jgi:hypothetical protein